MTEKIAAAALKARDQVYTGPTHAACMNAILTDERLTSDQKVAMLLDTDDGFVTNTGRFVSREEAFQIAQAQKQMTDHQYSEPEANKAFYGGAEPRLDSGLIKEWAEFTDDAKARLHG